jgi:hypothetical protein
VLPAPPVTLYGLTPDNLITSGFSKGESFLLDLVASAAFSFAVAPDFLALAV